MTPCAVTVVLCTYNRAAQLATALQVLVAQAGLVDYEIVVVDNNSSDGTEAVVTAFGHAPGGNRLRYVFEPRQGLSFARNRGVREARGSIVAFTDDDVRVEPDWIQQVDRAFAEHPAVAYIGGRVLPHWTRRPPRWLTRAHWSPLALQDYGAEPFVTSRDRAVCLVGANLAVRRFVFDKVGTFAPELGRIKDGIGSTEDHEFQLRVWRAGLRGRYEPSIVAVADVTPDRMDKAYHRRWHRGHGQHCAAMRLRERVPADMGPMSEPGDLVLLFGSPAFVYRDLLYFAGRWLRAVFRREDSFFYANKLRQLWSYVRTARSQARPEASRLAELASFAHAYRRKRRLRRMA